MFTANGIQNQSPELWNILNSRIEKSEDTRFFPLSNGTELDRLGSTFTAEKLLSFHSITRVRARSSIATALLVCRFEGPASAGRRTQVVNCRMPVRSGAFPGTRPLSALSGQKTVPKNYSRDDFFPRSEREKPLPLIMTTRGLRWNYKKREGYFLVISRPQLDRSEAFADFLESRSK